MKIEITDKFHNDSVINKAYSKASSREVFMFVWCAIAKRMLQSGTHMIQAKKINSVHKIVEIPNTLSDDSETDANTIAIMKELDMIRISDTEVSLYSLGDDKYEEWIAAYPYRDVNGKRVKVRGKSKLRFHNQIRNEQTFNELMNATLNYAQLCNKFPKDPERFLLNDFWKEYITVESVRPEPVDSNSIDRMMR